MSKISIIILSASLMALGAFSIDTILPSISYLKKDFDFLPSKTWKQKELLSEEFKALGFYLSDHPLNEYEDIFNQLKITSYSQFYESESNEGLVAGTIMAIQEKKSAKGTPYGIVKFSDKKGEFELFLFAEILVSNREKMKESESFILTLQKDKIAGDSTKIRVNVRKILSLDEVINKPYSRVTIELKSNYDINEIKELLSKEGDTEINIIIKDKNKEAHYSLKNNRKFDLNQIFYYKTSNMWKK